ncbi:MAG TPA: PQQ-binding-like beta-propeller repeat protein [Solirubrobacteraceae bacterium]|jgi:outer membrane protein assembly factor BamB|nr:PQQ-binding-like beta-propeller repeat protein [Solirubrobacteraceae bacterium]
MRAALAVVALAIVGAAVGAYLYEHNRTGSIYHPHARFFPQPSPTLPKKGPDRFAWPLYGYSPQHTRYFPAPADVHPPFKKLWQHNEGALLEFPPVIYGDHIFQLADDGVISAINKHTGHLLWKHSLGTLSASTPAVSARTVFATVLATGGTGGPGRVWALNYETGQTRWVHSLSSPSESSPLLARGRLYFGSQGGTVYCLDARSGHVLWTYHASGSVKASPTLFGNTLYFGDYSGHVQAISAASGRLIWRSGSEGAVFGSGTFYSTAAVEYGRVFLGNTDGRLYAYDAYNGHLDWAVQTGDYVYASPAVTDAPGLGPTVYFGSYSGEFYALNARSGSVSWTFHTHGRISGSPTIIGRIVYFADLGEKHTYGLGISTGKLLFSYPRGTFDPVISDSERIYFTGSTGIYGLAPR